MCLLSKQPLRHPRPQAPNKNPKPNKKPSRGFPQGNSALLPIAHVGHFCKLNMFWSFSIFVQKLFPQHRPFLHPFLLCFIVQYRNCQFYSLHCCTGLCNRGLKLSLKGLVGTDLQAEKMIKASEEKRVFNSNDLCNWGSVNNSRAQLSQAGRQAKVTMALQRTLKQLVVQIAQSTCTRLNSTEEPQIPTSRQPKVKF